MRLLTIYNNYYIELDQDNKPNQDYILSIKSINNISISLVLCLLYKEVKIITLSKGIIIEGVAINTIKIVGIDSKQKGQPLLNKLQLILRDLGELNEGGISFLSLNI